VPIPEQVTKHIANDRELHSLLQNDLPFHLKRGRYETSVHAGKSSYYGRELCTRPDRRIETDC
jgi:hypothetical protein